MQFSKEGTGNFIGAGGSGITFYQGPDNKNGTPTQDMHDNVVRFKASNAPL